jgi:nitrogen fixation protein FixH
MIRTEPAPFRRSLWIPWTIAGCFVIVVAVNVLMAWCAAWSWTGLVSPSAYDQGLTYNRHLAA